MKKSFIIFLLFIVSCVEAQTITFKGCPNLFSESNTFTFNSIGIDETGRNIYATTPINGDQPCPSGACEFKILWNQANMRWEFIADSGDGDFLGSNLIYSNVEESTPNPPSLSLGTWEENIAVTSGECGGNLSNANATLTGAVQNTLSKDNFLLDQAITFYPNPIKSVLNVRSSITINQISIWNLQGQSILVTEENSTLDLSHLQSGIYIMKFVTDQGIKIANIIKN
ncbi:T9SS type A sorting domain-containing protein [Flavobacterium luminosum]|uniref:T9SS type A sorting domain-containing protein n=1 Tax=Flavobacterium luminosum TaxID=2949086 RepID=A0ABT0TKW7_9FLAO|nr:T9SS type A sorting domain-containing protein [Flavobacterium sp. HXWNR70]MCL9808131.1 T9SS type A sorting domain-containing protein [Flavobacterium sp. HXWNR70]